jgi:hypothetical protein
MISVITGCNRCGYSLATGVLDKTFGSGGIVVHNNAAGGNSYDYVGSMYVDKTGKIYVTVIVPMVVILIW